MVERYVEGFYAHLCGLVYATLNTGCMWVTWMHRFSGNSNFFYFQTKVYGLFITFIFLNSMHAAEEKRNKYLKELKAII